MAGDANAITPTLLPDPEVAEDPQNQTELTSLIAQEDDSVVTPGMHIHKKTFLERVRIGLAIFGGLYVFAIVLLCIPYFQRHTVYLNAVRIPFFADYNVPEKYALSPNKTLNFHVRTPDNETLGAWFILSDSYYQSLPSAPANVSEHITFALKRYPTILFFHGNAATRAFSVRVQHYKAFSSRLHANVLAIDYRGFGESTGIPSEKGLVTDARAAWDWLISRGAKQENILVIGHSLGTGVSAQLGAEMSRDNIRPRGIVLLSPFSSIREVLNTYHIFGIVPLIKPLAVIPYATSVVSRALVHKFDSLHAVPNITADVLISHAIDDWDIPYSHSEVLFQAFLEPHLPELDIPANPLALNSEAWSIFNAQSEERRKSQKELVITTEMPNFGTMQEFEAKGRKVAYVKTLTGGHDYLGVQEGLQDVIGRWFELF